MLATILGEFADVLDEVTLKRGKLRAKNNTNDITKLLAPTDKIYYIKNSSEKEGKHHKSELISFCYEAYSRVGSTHLHLYVRKIYAYIVEVLTQEHFGKLDLSLNYTKLTKKYSLSTIEQMELDEEDIEKHMLDVVNVQRGYEYFHLTTKAKKYQYYVFYNLAKNALDKARSCLSSKQYAYIREALDLLSELHTTASFSSRLYVPSDYVNLNSALNSYGLYIPKEDIYKVDFNDKAKNGLWVFLAI